MLRRITVTSGVVAALAVATLTGCSTSKQSSAHSGAAQTSSSASVTPSPSTGSATDPTTTATTSSAAAHNANAAGVNVCSLLTAAQATSLNKVTYSSTTAATPATDYQTCTYTRTASVDPVDIQSLTVTVISIPGCWAQLKSTDGPGKTISGVGQAAFGSGVDFDVEAGSRCVEVSGLTHAELLNNWAPDAAMAKIIVAKLN